MGWSQMRQHAAVVPDVSTSTAGSTPMPGRAAPEPDDSVVVALNGADPWPTVAEFERNLEAALAARPRTLVVDMSEVAEVSSSTVAELLRTRRVCASRGVDVLLRHPSARCLATLSRVGLLRVLTVEPAGPDARVRSGNGGGRP